MYYLSAHESSLFGSRSYKYFVGFVAVVEEVFRIQDILLSKLLAQLVVLLHSDVGELAL